MEDTTPSVHRVHRQVRRRKAAHSGKKWGRAWVCKIHLEQLKTDDKTQRYNYTRRMQEIFDDETKGGRDLLLWRNKMLMGAGFPPL